MMFKKLAMIAFGAAIGIAHAQDIATCRSPAGKAFYHHSGLISKAESGWTDDRISSGVFSLIKTNEKSLDLIYLDALQKPISSTQDGGSVIVLDSSKSNISILIAYPGGTTEIYSFFREKDGRHRFTMMQNKVGDSVRFPKSNLMVGDCDSIRFLIN